ncbi:50S ribosomal protein L22 [archaeon]|nr:50S ribosomal protein L22 [archaeon]
MTEEKKPKEPVKKEEKAVKPKEPVKKEKPKEPVKQEKPKEEPKLVDKSEHFAIARSLSLPISTKQAVEISNFIRKKELQIARKLLQEVLDKKKALPFKRYNRDMGHKPGKIASGRYPEKAISYFIKILRTAEANAEDKGLDINNLIITELKADKGPQQWHYGRLRRRKMKNTHLYVKVMEKEND